MDSRNYVTNRAGRAPKNWKYDNTIMAEAYFTELLKRQPIVAKAGEELEKGKKAQGGEVKQSYGAEKLGEKHLAYAIEGRSRLAVKIYRAILQGSTYHIFDDVEYDDLAKRSSEVKKKMEDERDRLSKQDLPPEVQRKIDNRINKLRAKGMGARIDRFKARRFIDPEAADKLLEVDKETRDEWKKKGATDEEINSLLNLNKEKNRLREQYIEDELHKNFYGEWPARFSKAS
jgi:hypothetical protein